MSRVRQLAWAAGLFEGEGCISLRRYKSPKVRRRPMPILRVSSTDEDVLRRFAKIVGHEHVRGPFKNGGKNWKPSYKLVWKWA